jgi:group I intron endonuclease
MGDYCVYKHTSPSGKVYIGITSQRPERRWRPDGSGYRYNPHFKNAINKYGWDNFKHEIVRDGLTRNEALDMEAALVSEYRSDSFAFGYNRSSGGDAPVLSPEATQKISESVSKLWEDPDYRAHMSEAHKGQRRTGWHHSETTKAKISDIVKERCMDPEYRKRLSESAKRRAAKRDMSEFARHAWEDPVARERIIASKRGNHYRAKRVLCVETGTVYQSVKEAAEAVGTTREAVGRACRGLAKKSKGLHWRFADE